MNIIGLSIGVDFMSKMKFGILVVFAILVLIGNVSAYGPISFGYNGDLVVTYVSSNAGYNNGFGVFQPGPRLLGYIHDVTPPIVYTDVGRCSEGGLVVVNITTPNKPVDPYGPQTYYSDRPGLDGKDHAIVTPNIDGSFNVAFEDSYNNLIDDDTNDVVLNVACTPDSIPSPEFPTLALPVGLLIGMVGVVLFVRKIKE
jgi:hypothetical protein